MSTACDEGLRGDCHVLHGADQLQQRSPQREGQEQQQGQGPGDEDMRERFLGQEQDEHDERTVRDQRQEQG